MRVKSRPSRHVLLVLGLALVGFSIFTLWQRYQATHKPSSSGVLSEITTNTQDGPSETKPSDADYNVPADQPKKINLPSIGDSGFIQKVGIDQTGAIAAPSNIHVAGWYVQSVRPGEKGLSVIDGHVSGKYSDGIFKHLASLQSGDKFEVEFGDGSTRSFVVISKQEVPTADAGRALLQKTPSINNQLNLITCSGKFNARSNSYPNRVIIVASVRG